MLQEVKFILFVLHVTLATTYLPRTPTEVYDVTTIYHVGDIYKNTTKEKRVEVHLRTNAKGLPINYGGWEVDDSVIGRHFPSCYFSGDWSGTLNHCPWLTEGWNLKFEEQFFSTGDPAIKSFTLDMSFFQVQKLPRKMKVELKGYFSYGSHIYIALLPNNTLSRDLSGFYRILFYCRNNYNYLQYCHLTENLYQSFIDVDADSIDLNCNDIANLGNFGDCQGNDANAVNDIYLDFSNEELLLEYQDQRYSWKPSSSNPLIDTKYFTMSYSEANSYYLKANCFAEQALQPNNIFNNSFPLISPWFTADTDELCVAIVFNGTGQVEINITAENIAQERYLLENSFKFYQPGDVLRLFSSLPKHLKQDKIRLILAVYNVFPSITIQRISSCNGEGRSDIAVLNFKEEITSKVAYDVNTHSRNIVGQWWPKYTPFKIHPKIVKTFNGGYQRNDTFACPPGFTDWRCKTACGRNRFGEDCKGVCSIYSYECRGLLLCTPVIGCQCAPGYSGNNCEEECHQGSYGNDCEQVCGNCENQSACDIYTGHCATCDSGYAPPFCKEILSSVHTREVCNSYLFCDSTVRCQLRLHEAYPVVESPPEVLISSYGQVDVIPKLSEYGGKGIPTMYQIQYRESGTSEWIVHDSYYTTFSFDYPHSTNYLTPTIKGLDHGKFYEIRTILFDDNLNSYQGESVPITTFLSLCSIPEEVDYHITSKTNSTFLTISWDYKNTSAYLCPVIHYEVSREENWQWVSENTTDTSFSLSNLLSAGAIKFKIRAYTSGGFAPYSKTTTVSTKLEDPGPVQSLSSRHPGSYEVIEWDPPKNFESKKFEYQLNIQCRMRIGCTLGCKATDSFELRVTSTTAKLYSLLPSTQYLVTVSAAEGPPTSILVGTKMSVPTEIVKPSSLPPVRTNHSVTVFWEPVEVCSGFSKGYIYQLADDSKIITTGSTKKNHFTVDKLSPKTNYFAKIFIETIAGKDEDKYLLLNISTSATVPEQVENLTIYKRGRNLLGLRWEQPKKLYGALKSFTISYGYGNNSEVVTVPPVPCIVWPQLYCHTLENLSPMKKYKVSVSARNTEVTDDGFPTSVTEITKEGTAGVPENVTIVNTTSTSFAVSWKYPSMANGILRSFLMSIEEVEQYETEQCCQTFPLVETIVEEELANYTAEVSGLHPASTYTVSLSAKTISFGPSVTLTLYTRPPSMPLQYLPNVTVMTREEWTWLPQHLLENVNNSEIYRPLIKGNILLVVQNSTTDNFLSGIEHKKLREELENVIKTDFYFVAEYEDGEIVIGTDESKQTQWGTLINPSLEGDQTYSLAAVQITEYCGVFNIDIVFSTTFTAA